MRDRRVEITVLVQWPQGMSRRAVVKRHKTNRIIMRRMHREAYRDMQRHGEHPWQLRAHFQLFRQQPRRRNVV